SRDGDLVAPDVDVGPGKGPLDSAEHLVLRPQQGDHGHVGRDNDLVYGLLAPRQSAARVARRREPVCLVRHVGWEPATLRSWTSEAARPQAPYSMVPARLSRAPDRRRTPPARSGVGQPGGQLKGRPASACPWTWKTDSPVSAP